MNLKLFGAVLIIIGCAGVGFSIASAYRKEEAAMKALIHAADFMMCELQYRMTPLPELCALTSRSVSGTVGTILKALAGELERQISPDASTCMTVVLSTRKDIPDSLKRNLMLLGQSLGRFDLTGQIGCLEGVKEMAKRDLAGLQSNRESRLRGYQTLGICAGVALVILFI